MPDSPGGRKHRAISADGSVHLPAPISIPLPLLGPKSFDQAEARPQAGQIKQDAFRHRRRLQEPGHRVTAREEGASEVEQRSSGDDEPKVEPPSEEEGGLLPTDTERKKKSRMRRIWNFLNRPSAEPIEHAQVPVDQDGDYGRKKDEGRASRVVGTEVRERVHRAHADDHRPEDENRNQRPAPESSSLLSSPLQSPPYSTRSSPLSPSISSLASPPAPKQRRPRQLNSPTTSDYSKIFYSKPPRPIFSPARSSFSIRSSSLRSSLNSPNLSPVSPALSIRSSVRVRVTGELLSALSPASPFEVASPEETVPPRAESTPISPSSSTKCVAVSPFSSSVRPTAARHRRIEALDSEKERECAADDGIRSAV